MYAEPILGTDREPISRTDSCGMIAAQLNPRPECFKARPFPTAALSWWLDKLLVMAEVVLRNFYWRAAALRRWRQLRERRRAAVIQACSREELRCYLQSIGVRDGALVMLHTRVTGVQILNERSPSKANSWQIPQMLLALMSELLGAKGTLAMVTNAKYQLDALEQKLSPHQIITYDPAKTPCSVGLANELFWRAPGVKRSLHPFNMLAVRGPLAEHLLSDNLNERKPSPHGVDSGYYRFCKLNGLVISIGVPLKDCLTIARVVEEVRPDWPINDFLTDQHYRVVQNGATREWTIRLLNEKYDKFCHCGKKMARDLVAEGVIHEGKVGTLRVDWARAGEVFDFFWRKTETRPYPYYGVWAYAKQRGKP